MEMSKRTRFLNACETYLVTHKGATATDLIGRVKSSFGRRYREIPTPIELGQLLRIDKRFIVIEKTPTSTNVWGLKDEE
tara:strand:- start:2024 stop:2260 length:237 start_codon:yes stop_codon:yes gene_type:complete